MDSRMIDWQKYAAGSETSCQIAIFGWFAENMDKYPETKYMFHIPNGGTRSAKLLGSKQLALNLEYRTYACQ